MKKGIHPAYREVLFHDISVDHYFLVGSTMETERTKEWQGKTYPYVTIEVSSQSHPHYTGKQRVVQKEGRVANFNRRFQSFSKGEK